MPGHATLATIALILGGVAIGTTGFVTLGLLPARAARGEWAAGADAGRGVLAHGIRVRVQQ